MICTITILGDYARVSSNAREGGLTLDMSDAYCHLFESTKSQGRDYMESICRWCGAKPENTDSLIRSLLIHLSSLRSSKGLAR